jgi:hypothetical protein
VSPAHGRPATHTSSGRTFAVCTPRPFDSQSRTLPMRYLPTLNVSRVNARFGPVAVAQSIEFVATLPTATWGPQRRLWSWQIENLYESCQSVADFRDPVGRSAAAAVDRRGSSCSRPGPPCGHRPVPVLAVLWAGFEGAASVCLGLTGHPLRTTTAASFWNNGCAAGSMQKKGTRKANSCRKSARRCQHKRQPTSESGTDGLDRCSAAARLPKCAFEIAGRPWPSLGATAWRAAASTALSGAAPPSTGGGTPPSTGGGTPVMPSYSSAAYWCRKPCGVTLSSALVMPQHSIT